jgi:hypothetical protein
VREERRSFGLVVLDLGRELEMLGDDDGKEPDSGGGSREGRGRPDTMLTESIVGWNGVAP